MVLGKASRIGAADTEKMKAKVSMRYRRSSDMTPFWQAEENLS